VVAGLRREVHEEAGIEIDGIELRGTVSWPGFGKHGEDWLGFVFRIRAFTGEPHSENPEGVLEWVDVDRILDLPLWEGDRHFLPLVFNDDPRQFHGIMPYRDGRPVSWDVSFI
jgi:8-oxo-dGTP diphosphatase